MSVAAKLKEARKLKAELAALSPGRDRSVIDLMRLPPLVSSKLIRFMRGSTYEEYKANTQSIMADLNMIASPGSIKESWLEFCAAEKALYTEFPDLD